MRLLQGTFDFIINQLYDAYNYTDWGWKQRLCYPYCEIRIRASQIMVKWFAKCNIYGGFSKCTFRPAFYTDKVHKGRTYVGGWFSYDLNFWRKMAKHAMQKRLFLKLSRNRSSDRSFIPHCDSVHTSKKKKCRAGTWLCSLVVDWMLWCGCCTQKLNASLQSFVDGWGLSRLNDRRSLGQKYHML